MNSQAIGLKVAAIIFALFGAWSCGAAFQTRKSNGRNSSNTDGDELGGSDHRRRTEHLDVATLFRQPLTFL